MAIRLRSIRQDEYAIWSEMLLDYDPDLTEQLPHSWLQLLATQRRETLLDAPRGFESYSAAYCLIAELNGEIAGLVMYNFHDFILMNGPICYLSDIYVKPEYRRNGIARFVLEHMIAESKKYNWERLYWITARDNEEAQALYDQYATPEFVRYHIDLKRSS